MGASRSKQSKFEDLHFEEFVNTVPYDGPTQNYEISQVEAHKSQDFSEELESLDDEYMMGKTADIDSYKPMLVEHYQRGKTTLESFYLVPSTRQSRNDPERYQAIFRLPSGGSPAKEDILYDLRVEKSLMIYKDMVKGIINHIEGTTSGTEGTTSGTEDTIFGTEGTTSGTEDTTSGSETTAPDDVYISKKIAQYSTQGGRLVCVALTGRACRYVKKGIVPDAIIDLFFEVPRSPSPPLFTYQAVQVPIPYRFKGRGHNKNLFVQFDYMEFFMTHLNQGWKLVGIILDKEVPGKNQTSSVWLFEKETTRVNNPTAVYEGTIVTHQRRVEGGNNGQKIVTCDFLPKLREMGEKGWELACPLDTLEGRKVGVAAVFTVLLFFQRRIIGEEVDDAPSTVAPRE